MWDGAPSTVERHESAARVARMRRWRDQVSPVGASRPEGEAERCTRRTRPRNPASCSLFFLDWVDGPWWPDFVGHLGPLVFSLSKSLEAWSEQQLIKKIARKHSDARFVRCNSLHQAVFFAPFLHNNNLPRAPVLFVL